MRYVKLRLTNVAYGSCFCFCMNEVNDGDWDVGCDRYSNINIVWNLFCAMFDSLYLESDLDCGIFDHNALNDPIIHFE